MNGVQIFLFLLFTHPVALAGCPAAVNESLLEAQSRGVKLEVLASAGDKIGKSAYRLVGVGDGLGLYSSDPHTAVVLMNHELRKNMGIKRAHGFNAAFVSKWVLDTRTRKLLHGEDQIKNLRVYDSVKNTLKPASTPLEQLCSADLPQKSALAFKTRHGFYGTSARIFFSGEELSTQYSARFGRAFAHVLTGPFASTSFELPKLGKLAFENIVLSPYPQKLTVAMLLDDTTNQSYTREQLGSLGTAIKKNPPSELYVYVGTKQRAGATPVEKAGLTNGALYGVRAINVAREDREWGWGKDRYLGTVRFDLHAFGDVSRDVSGWQLQVDSINNQVTQFLRVEDGVWNTLAGKQNEFYFTTTDQFNNGNTRLHRLTFDDILQPLKGGKLEIVLNGRDHAMKMLDNITFDPWGRILLQEDPGAKGENYLARIWLFNPKNAKVVPIAQHKAKYFHKGQPQYLTNNEESSGIIPAFDALGAGWYLLNVQAHVCHPDREIVQHGQFVALYIPKHLGQ